MKEDWSEYDEWRKDLEEEEKAAKAWEYYCTTEVYIEREMKLERINRDELVTLKLHDLMTIAKFAWMYAADEQDAEWYVLDYLEELKYRKD